MKRVAELERVLGKKTLENDILKAAVERARKKTDLARAIVRDLRFPLVAETKALSVSRSNLYERPDDPKLKRGAYAKLGNR